MAVSDEAIPDEYHPIATNIVTFNRRAFDL